MTEFTRTVIAIIQSIPAGKVMTYGQIAALAGHPRAARQVVRVLHTMSRKYQLPWHRVINSKGEIGIRDYDARTRQLLYLESEGVEFIGERIDLEEYLFHPTQTPSRT